MQDFVESNGCCKCEPETSKSSPGESVEKFYQQISTEMIGNSLTIRVEKDPNKKGRKSRNSWYPPCDCDMVEIRRPSARGEVAKIVNAGDNNKILFQVNSKTRISKDQVNKSQAIAYKVGSCRGGAESNDQCRTITVYPQMGGPGSQEVHSDRLTAGNRDVFLLRIKKKPDTLDPRQRNIELELRTPRPPTPEPGKQKEKEEKEKENLETRVEKIEVAKKKEIGGKVKRKKGKKKVIERDT